ncbi:peptide chain release factor 1 [Homalodisca vitripennis]|uniref:peptide chain release factor 1 n=1 Tax=Homalodisca vitripennis TaxID=197043 RepID=UPI001EEB898D|nr:peptide chain release factor 1 [Homalodisca vitripennis]
MFKSIRIYSGLVLAGVKELKLYNYDLYNIRFVRNVHAMNTKTDRTNSYYKFYLETPKSLCQCPFRIRFQSTASRLDNDKLYQFLKNINADVLNSKFSVNKNSSIFNLMAEKDKLEDTLKQLESMKESGGKDEKEMLDLIEDDLIQYKNELNQVYKQILDCLMPKENFEDCNDIVMEISPGVGGSEAMLFASELRDMYCGFLDYKGWQYFIAENDESDLGGVRHCSLLVSGPEAYNVLQHEAGVHRVQRVPVTERGGRVHTSTVSVAVLPQPSDIEVNLKETDLKIETKRASGAGGQHVNTTDSAVRITHIPTGIVVECQSCRSQIQNKTTALKRLQAKIYERELNQMDSDIRKKRKIQIGTSARSEKIRTYNFRDDRISDHRITTNLHNLRQFLQGGEALDGLLCELRTWRHNLRIQQFISSLPP